MTLLLKAFFTEREKSVLSYSKCRSSETIAVTLLNVLTSSACDQNIDDKKK